MTVLTKMRKCVLLVSIATTAIATGNAPAADVAPDLFSFASGARIIAAPADASMTAMEASPLNLIDDSAATDWTGEAGKAVFVLELAELTELSRISFDTAGLNRDAKAPQAFTVEVSEKVSGSDYEEVLGGTLKMAKNGQSFTFKPEEKPTARRVRLTILSNYGDDYQGFTGFHGYGKQVTQDATMPDLAGKYDGASGWGRLNITDGEDKVTGCYEYQQGQFSGTVDGRVLKLNMLQRADGVRLSGMFQMSPDGEKLIGLVRGVGPAARDAYADYYSAVRVSPKPNGC